MPYKLIADQADYSGFRYIRAKLVIGEVVEDITVPAILLVDPEDLRVLMFVGRYHLPEVRRQRDHGVTLGSGFKATDQEFGEESGVES